MDVWGYREARQLLKEHYANDMKKSEAYLGKALKWTAIEAQNRKMQHEYAVCCNIM